MCVCVHIYIERERERERYTHMYIYIYMSTYIYIYISISLSLSVSLSLYIYIYLFMNVHMCIQHVVRMSVGDTSASLSFGRTFGCKHVRSRRLSSIALKPNYFSKGTIIVDNGHTIVQP